ncbi:MAG: cytochrome C [Rhodanobacter sp.]|uniref:cytochrome C n=1 Tax=Rhodanobacter sp. KK11 TaxID=3083255 RepID=UPI0029666C77|nr:cytochrome C [Rhodanobacter sp. KK11]MDW2980696.1 cytochrome C [Rhodanobacter sp. KK11]
MNGHCKGHAGGRFVSLRLVRRWMLLAVLAWLAVVPTLGLAMPSYARQTQLACVACHVGAFGPELTAFGRQFKLMGYTMKVGDAKELPLSAMLVESFTHTQKAQAEAPAKGFGTNDNTELQQASVFLAGRLSEHIGIFAQATYSENGGLLGWDNVDLRYARMFSRGSHTGIWGITVNNNPTVSDVFNTAPAWMYPYLSADLAPGAPAQPMLFGGLGGQVIGASAYVQLDGAWYLEAGGYRSLSPAFLRRVNADFNGRLSGVTPYARLAYTWNLPDGNVSVGGFMLNMRRGQVGTNAAGDAVALPGPTDRFRDFGVDSSYMYINGDHAITVDGLYVHESQRLDATWGGGGSDHLHDTLQSLNLKGSYWYRHTYGVTLASFVYNGSRDVTLYGNDGAPNTRGESIELDYSPFGQPDSWQQPWANARLGLQYTWFNRFSGRVHNIDGAGRNASDNNTLYFYVWLAI